PWRAPPQYAVRSSGHRREPPSPDRVSKESGMRQRLDLIVVVAFALAVAACGGDDDTSHGTSCADGVKNADETGIDCGGSSCPRCSAGSSCATGGDCASGICDGGVCACSEGFTYTDDGRCVATNTCEPGFAPAGDGSC